MSDWIEGMERPGGLDDLEVMSNREVIERLEHELREPGPEYEARIRALEALSRWLGLTKCEGR